MIHDTMHETRYGGFRYTIGMAILAHLVSNVSTTPNAKSSGNIASTGIEEQEGLKSSRFPQDIQKAKAEDSKAKIKIQ